jgi:hypothetical protein
MDNAQKAAERNASASVERGISFTNQISLANLEMKRATVTQQKISLYCNEFLY